MEKNLPKIIFFGTSDFALPSLDSLKKERYKILAIVTSPDKPVGRKKIITPSPVKVWGEANLLSVLTPEKLKDAAEEIKKISPDLGIIASYGKIIPEEILRIPQKGFINVHPSLLPKWRGPSPIQSAILSGDKKTGVTIHITKKEVDAGEILATRETGINKEEAYLELKNRLAEMGAGLLIEIISKYLSGEITPQAQNESEATYSKIIRTEDGEIEWEDSAENILNKIRALNPEPGTFTFWDKKRLIISSAASDFKSHDFKPGTVVGDGASFKIAAGAGFIIPRRVKIEGRNETTSNDFLAGNSKILGAVLGQIITEPY